MTVSELLRGIVVIFSLVLLSACQFSPPVQHNETLEENEFSINSVAKTDINMVFDYQVRTIERHLTNLMSKLYRRNPRYWRAYGYVSAEARTRYVLSLSDKKISRILKGTRSIDSIYLAFDLGYGGDRVMALVFGLKTMLYDAYGRKQDFYVLDQLDPQKLYNAARNIEVAVWKLSNGRLPDGQLILVSNELDGEIKNLSFERLFGKLIAIQDSNAAIVADSTNRTIKTVIQRVAAFVFLPI